MGGRGGPMGYGGMRADCIIPVVEDWDDWYGEGNDSCQAQEFDSGCKDLIKRELFEGADQDGDGTVDGDEFNHFFRTRVWCGYEELNEQEEEFVADMANDVSGIAKFCNKILAKGFSCKEKRPTFITEMVIYSTTESEKGKMLTQRHVNQLLGDKLLSFCRFSAEMFFPSKLAESQKAWN